MLIKHLHLLNFEAKLQRISLRAIILKLQCALVFPAVNIFTFKLRVRDIEHNCCATMFCHNFIVGVQLVRSVVVYEYVFILTGDISSKREI